MGKKVVTIDEMIDLAIGTPESTVNFLMLQKVLKLITTYCCKMDYKFEMDMDNMKGEITKIGNDTRSYTSASSESQESYESRADSGRRETNNETVQAIDQRTEIKREKDYEADVKEEKVHVKVESEDQKHSTDQKIAESDSEKQKQSESSSRKDSSRYSEREKKETKHKKESESHSKRNDSKRRSSEKHKKRSSEHVKNKDSEGHKRRESDNTKNRMDALEHFTKDSQNRTNELDNHLKELTERIENITQTIATHIDEKHLAEINEEIDKLRQNTENSADQYFEVTSTINDQSSQIQEIVTTINEIQLRKVENEELIDLLSGKADHSFVNEKVSTSQFEEIIQELKDVINESTIQMDSVRLETNTSLDEIKQELLTKLLAEEFDTAKTKIYKELIKLTEQQELILAQQNEHVSAGAKMRNLSCFACDNDVVMLLEQETIPKFRGLKASLQPLEPIVASKIFTDKNAPEWKNHQLKAKDFTRTSKASRFNRTDARYETYVKGKNGCMYKGYVGCDCVEAMDDIAKTKRQNCCDMVAANNMKNISQTNKINSNSKIIGYTEIGDVAKNSAKIDNNLATDHQDHNLKIEIDVQPTTGLAVVENKIEESTEAAQLTTVVAVRVETTSEKSTEVAQPTDNIDVSHIIEIKNEIEETITNNDTATNIPDEVNTNTDENNGNTVIEGQIDENLPIKTEKDESDLANKENSD